MIFDAHDAAGIRLARALAPRESGVPDAERYARAVWSHLAEPGESTAGALVAALGPIAALDAAADTGGLVDEMLEEGRRRWRPRLVHEPIARSLATAARRGIRLVVPGDPHWPSAVDDLGDHAPIALWTRGDPTALVELSPGVALVGARAATSYGEHTAAELAADLCGAGIAVVSGGAYGIDGAAHRAALGVGGMTVAVMAGGVDRTYPSGNTDLVERIVASGGAVIAEVPCGAAPTKWRFLQRNRLIAALADATVVVEAGWRSGSLNTAGHAASLGRPIGAVPGPITSAASAGTHRLLREYDAVCITGTDDVLELLGEAPRARVDAEAGPRVSEDTRVLDAMSVRTSRTVDDIARRSGHAPADVEARLGLLRLSGDVEPTESGWRRRPR
ncbi:DNA-processing protein DprA [Microbacterium awajiense]|uniref:DNA-processing protein DprA n=1 Tax=Microbacterium awajiense TaxID=415214 RepID=A0ABP7A8D3_9MICO